MALLIEEHTMRAAVNRLFSTAWLVLLAGGALGGMAFIVLATTLDRAETWAGRSKDHP